MFICLCSLPGSRKHCDSDSDNETKELCYKIWRRSHAVSDQEDTFRSPNKSCNPWLRNNVPFLLLFFFFCQIYFGEYMSFIVT